MKLLRSILLFTTAFAFVASAQAAPADKSENAKLEGTWVGGVRAPAGKAKNPSGTMVQISELTIKDGKIVACKDGKGVSLGNCESLSLNPAAKTMDATGNTKEKKGVFEGIYRVNGNTLEWCAANPGIARPKDFFTTPQVQFHMVFTKKP
ncbi:MAG: hypothetical protein EBS05_06765 [Proteobacteria bacterium]|jgi:uncharacterized protein (TIGR03067 family)|nr:hypothetical protein [Pseudomonadota bacterium]